MAKSLLVEIQTEELPPKALEKLSEAFAGGLFSSLKKQGFLTENSQLMPFGAPRRLAAVVTEVLEKSPDVDFKQRLVPVKVGLDAAGNPTAALTKKLQALGLTADVSKLLRVNDGKQEQLYYEGKKPGISIDQGLQAALDSSVAALPIPKVMSYQLEDGKTTVQFVRPVKKLVALYGERIVPVSLFGLQAGRLTNGHRFHTHMPIEIRSADEYSQQMVATGKVIPSYKARRACMVEQLEAAAKKLNAEIIMPQDLVDEVAALTEWPVVYESGFDEEFLSVPEECLILTMQQNQKYFALRDQNHKLINRFLLVSHIVAKDGGEAIKSGNARVVRARLADAKFFYDQDRMQTLESRVPGLEHVVYHNKLGTQLQRSLRVQAMARRIAEKIGADPKLAERAAKLAKADLRTLMVGEFPELQGIMGEYYARNDKEDPLVCLAIREHYQPRFSGDALPSTPVSLAVALADKIETLAGLFGIGQIPTGDKDPYALRRHALGILRMIRELRLPLSLTELIDIAMEEESAVEGVKDVRSELKAFFKDRLRVMLKDEGYSALEVEAVLAAEPKELNEVKDRLEAVRAFAALPEAQSLAAANKRIENILKKNELPLNGTISEDLLEAEEEKALYRALEEVKPKVAARMKKAEYTAALSEVAPLKLPVDNFFESVMVNSENEALRKNRLELLHSLHNEMNRVARLSVLAG